MTGRRLSTAVRVLVAATVASVALVASAHAAPAAPAAVRVNSFLITAIGFDGQPYVALKNFTRAPSTLAGLHLCQGVRCYALPAVSVKPGRTVRIATRGGRGLANVVARRATLGKLRPANGEIGLYASRSLKNPKAMLTYLQWGSPMHTLTPIAVKAGLWQKGSYAPSSPGAVLLRRTAGGLWVYR